MMSFSKLVLISLFTLAYSGFYGVSFANEVKVDRDCDHWNWQGPYEEKKWNGDRQIFIYRGECANGLANGMGTLSSYDTALSVYAKSKKKIAAKNEYKGFFWQGVYLGRVKYKGVFLFDKFRVATQLGESNGHPVWLLTAQPEGWGIPLPICKPKAINIGVSELSGFSDDAATRAEFKQAFELYSKICPNTDFDVVISIGKKEQMFIDNRADKTILAEMNNSRDKVFGFYRNKESYAAASKSEQKRQTELKKQKTDKIHNQIVKLFKSSKVKSIVSLEELAKNPYRWEGGNIAVVVTLDEMISRDTALLKGRTNTYSKGAYITEVKPAIFNDNAILVVVSVKGKSTINDKSLATVAYVNHYNCEMKDCNDIEFSGLENYPDITGAK